MGVRCFAEQKGFTLYEISRTCVTPTRHGERQEGAGRSDLVLLDVLRSHHFTAGTSGTRRALPAPCTFGTERIIACTGVPPSLHFRSLTPLGDPHGKA